MSPPNIPPEQLERFARELGLSQAILVGWQPGVATHVVTWGASLIDSAQAAQGGNAVKLALGFPEDLCRDLSPRVAAALERAEGKGVRFHNGYLEWPGGGMNLAMLRSLLERAGLQITGSEVPR
jgi:hypothetical protein